MCFLNLFHNKPNQVCVGTWNLTIKAKIKAKKAKIYAKKSKKERKSTWKSTPFMGRKFFSCAEIFVLFLPCESKASYYWNWMGKQTCSKCLSIHVNVKEPKFRCGFITQKRKIVRISSFFSTFLIFFASLSINAKRLRNGMKSAWSLLGFYYYGLVRPG